MSVIQTIENIGSIENEAAEEKDQKQVDNKNKRSKAIAKSFLRERNSQTLLPSADSMVSNRI